MISIVVPVYNEQDALPELYKRVVQVMKTVDMSYEIIFINDGSTDKSLEIMLELCGKNEDVKVLEFSRNFGHQVAIAAGLDYSSGEAVITMDADLQHPPELIPELIKKWQDGYKVVRTCRQATANTSYFKNISSRFFYFIINRLSEDYIPPGAADFQLLDRSAVESFRRVGERTLFLRGLVSWMGYKQIAIPYEASSRYGGESKYSFIRMLRFAIDGTTSFSSMPLYFAGFIGIIISILSFAYAGFAIYARLFTNRALPGWTSVMAAVLFLGGVHLISVGIQGAYLGRIYNEVKARPRYLINNKYNFGR
jgi:polyisoprenyl-phosphate glycosyltransferase